jgi:sulfatase modifying factor 1
MIHLKMIHLKQILIGLSFFCLSCGAQDQGVGQQNQITQTTQTTQTTDQVKPSQDMINLALQFKQNVSVFKKTLHPPLKYNKELDQLINSDQLAPNQQKLENLEKQYEHLLNMDTQFEENSKNLSEDWQKIAKSLDEKRVKLKANENTIDEELKNKDKEILIKSAPVDIVAFIETYGADDEFNPYFKNIDQEFLVNLDQTIDQARLKRLKHKKNKLDLLLIIEGFEQVLKIQMPVVLIRGGSFHMGYEDPQSAQEPHAKDDHLDEMPTRLVEVDDFYISKTEVTVAQYSECMKADVCSEPDQHQNCNWIYSDRNQHPINCIDWTQARTFAKWVGGDLPTEAQWEYASTSEGRHFTYPWHHDQANCEYAVMNDDGEGCGKGSSWPVCSKINGHTKQGLCDMAGNVWEWVLDEWHPSYEGAPLYDLAWCRDAECSADGLVDRVYRGGGWKSYAHALSSTNRYHTLADKKHQTIGFRVSFKPTKKWPNFF